MKYLQLLPVGEVDPRLLDGLVPSLAREFAVPCEVLDERLGARFAYHSERAQFHSSAILAEMQRFVAPDTWRILGVTTHDLYIPILTFVFGEAQMGGPCALVSAHRLTQEFYGLPADPAVFFQRLLKEAVHELGHTVDLTHCPDYSCVMAASHAVEWIDLKGYALCRDCRTQARAGRAAAR